jgi:hypothetical protein
MNKYLGLLLCMLLLMGACKREAVPTVSRKELKELAIKEVDFKYLTTRSKINFDDGERRIGATANIRIRKDSIIWFSVTPGFGIEAARGLVTQDSLFLINKLEKSYYAYSFPELSQKLNVNLSYDVFQAALLGDMLKPVSRRDKIDRQEDHVLIMQDEPQFNILNYISKETLKLDRVVLQDKASTNALTLNYDDFKPLEGNVLPYSSTISAQYRNKQDLKTTTVAFKHNKAEFSDSPLSFPFDIPDKYDRKK